MKTDKKIATNETETTLSLPSPVTFAETETKLQPRAVFRKLRDKGTPFEIKKGLVLSLTEDTVIHHPWELAKGHTGIELSLSEDTLCLATLSLGLAEQGLHLIDQVINPAYLKGELTLRLAWAWRIQQERPLTIPAGTELATLFLVERF